MVDKYIGMSTMDGRSDVYAQIVGDVVKVVPDETAGWMVSFDKKPTQVQ